MGFQALFKFVKCWHAPDIIRETVPSSWGCNDERTLANFQTSARDKQSAVSYIGQACQKCICYVLIIIPCRCLSLLHSCNEILSTFV